MKFLFLVAVCVSTAGFAQSRIGEFPPFTKWYQNPLGVSPISLHTANGIIIPAVAVSAILLFTEKDSTILDRWKYFGEAGFARSYFGNYTSVIQSNCGVIYFARRWLGVGLELTAYQVSDKVNHTLGLGVRPFARFYFLQSKRVNSYFESGAGLIGFFDEFPQPSGFFGDTRTGTHFNGSPKYGIGVEYHVTKSTSLLLNLRHIHVSNGDHPSKERNPGHDSNGISLGVQFSPKQDR